MGRRTDYLLTLGCLELLFALLIGCAEQKHQPNTAPSSTSARTSEGLTYTDLRHLTVEVALEQTTQPFHDACSQGDINAVQELLNNAVDMNIQMGDDRQTCLMLAVSHGFSGLIDWLLEKGAAVNATDAAGKTALHIGAAQPGAQGILSALIQRGAIVNKKDQQGLTPLHVAAYHGRAAAVKVLLDHGADVNATDNEGRTPLDYLPERDSSAAATILKQDGGKGTR